MSKLEPFDNHICILHILVLARDLKFSADLAHGVEEVGPPCYIILTINGNVYITTSVS